MPKYRKQPARVRWHADMIRRAVEKVLSKILPERTTVKTLRKRKSSLYDKIRSLKQKNRTKFFPKFDRYSQKFNPSIGDVLLNHVKELSNRFWYQIRTDIQTPSI